MREEKFFAARLVDRRDFSIDLARFRFEPTGDFRFVPGQYATIGIEQETVIQRPYSIASSPDEPFLEFFIELVPAGVFTPRLWSLNLGDEVLIRKKAVGKFTLDEATYTRHLMMATVTGIAPFVSMIRTQRIRRERESRPLPHSFLVIHGASRSWELGDYLGELSKLSREGWITYVPTVSRPWEDKGWDGETGRVEDVLRKHADQLGFNNLNAVAYAAGHPQMVENTHRILLRARFREEQVKEEKYFALDVAGY